MASQAEQSLVKWIALNAQHPEIRLVACRKAWGAVRLEIAGCRHLTEAQRTSLLQLGFFHPHRTKGRALVRRDAKFSLGEIRQVFPGAAAVLMPAVDAMHIAPPRTVAFQPATPQLQEKLDGLSIRPLGRNGLGERVYEGDEGRFVVGGDGKAEVEQAGQDEPRYLRSADAVSLAGCADGFVAEMAAGRVMRADDLRAFASDVTGISMPDLSGSSRMREVQEAVEAAMVRFIHKFAAAQGRSEAEVFAMSSQLLERQPSFAARTSSSVALQQYSSPLPMAVAAQAVLGPTAGLSILEPTVGNGALISMIRDASIIGCDLDDARINQLSSGRADVALNKADATTVDFVALNSGRMFDAVVCNPPFGRLPEPVSRSGLKVTRLDHLVLLRSLACRHDHGVGVFIIGADTYVDSRAGKLSGSSRYLFNWLSDNYTVDVVEIPGRMYAKQGATFPVRVVVVGARGSGAAVPDEIPILDTPAALLDWALRMRSKHRAPGGPGAEAYLQTQQSAGTMPPMPAKVDIAESVQHYGAAIPNEIDGEIAPADVIATEAKANSEDRAGYASTVEANSYQAPYAPMSSVGKTTAMIPRNLALPTRMALERVADAHGDVDSFVAESLNWSLETLERFMSPEQVDALALAIHADIASGGAQGFLMGDQTGQGKGRFLAAMARYHVLSGRDVVFLTETPTLFTDFWRDVRSIESADLFRPLIVNAGVGIYDDVTGKKLLDATPASVVKKAISDMARPAGYNLLMATYSQFNRSANASVSNKAAWLPAIADGAVLIMDESHNAAGDSNTNVNCAAAVDASYGVIYSSATSIKEPKNLQIYSRLFPATVNVSTLHETLITGGEPLQEIISSMLASDGVFIRREHDLSRLEFRVMRDSEDRVQRNRELSDHLAEVLEGMSYLAGDINKLVSERNKEIEKLLAGMPDHERKGSRMGAVSINYFSRLFNIYRQFLLALQVDLAVDRSLEALRSGKKPVVVLENTMESLLRDVLDDSFVEDSMDDREPSTRGSSSEALGGVGLGEGLTFRDVLHRTLDKLSSYAERDRYGEVRMVEVRSEEALATIAALRRSIESMPSLAIAPIDQIRSRIVEEGYRCGELTGRSIGLSYSDGQWFPRQLTQQPKAQVIQAFVSGVDDAIVISRSGSTGVSMHAGPDFQDQRQRVMIEAQLALDVTRRVQFHGRVNRRGQTSEPVIETLSTGLPGQARPIAMANAKLRRLSANTTSNQENASLDDTVPDFLNSIGDEVAFRYLEDHPDIARRLDIDIDVELDGAHEQASYFINKLTSRLVMLRVSEQEEIYASLTAEYNALIKELDEKGENPLRSAQVDLRATFLERSIFEAGQPGSRSVFNEPVYLQRLRTQREVTPLRYAQVCALVDSAKRVFSDAAPGAVDPASAVMEQLADFLIRERERLLDRALPAKFTTAAEAIADKSENAVKRLVARLDFLDATLRKLTVGAQVAFTDHEGEVVRGIAVGVSLPQSERQIDTLGSYKLKIAVPGQSVCIERSLHTLRNDPCFEVCAKWAEDKRMGERFDCAPAGLITEERFVLDGNLFKAAELASTQRLGSSVLYTDEGGQRHRGVLLRKGWSPEMLAKLPLTVETPAMAAAIFKLDPLVRLSSCAKAQGDASKDVLLYASSGDYILSCPGTKSRGGHVFCDSRLLALVGEFAGARATMSARFSGDKVESVVEALGRVGVRLHAPSRFRDSLNTMHPEEKRYNNESYEDSPERRTAGMGA